MRELQESTEKLLSEQSRKLKELEDGFKTRELEAAKKEASKGLHFPELVVGNSVEEILASAKACRDRETALQSKLKEEAAAEAAKNFKTQPSPPPSRVPANKSVSFTTSASEMAKNQQSARESIEAKKRETLKRLGLS